MKIQSIRDAETFVSNSGVFEWEFGNPANLYGLAKYVRKHCNSYTDIEPQFNNLLCNYLESIGENISDYSLHRS